jgi:hypothetical protein
LRVGEAVWVDDGEDVEVVFVFVGGGCGIGGVEELEGCVLDDPGDFVSDYFDEFG